jgi:multiple antibiotic resistance protein
MSDLVSFSITVFMGFFAIMNPIANAPIFLGLTASLSDRERRAIALRSTMLAFLIVAAFSIGGHLVFEVFGIGLPAFRTTGGVLVFLVGKHLLEGQHRSPVQSLQRSPRPGVWDVGQPGPRVSLVTLAAEASSDAGDGDAPEELESRDRPEDAETAIAISPLAIPILAGPGTIACAVNFASGRTPLHILICLLGFALLCAVTYVVFTGAEKVMRFLGKGAMSVTSRLMGLILAVIGVQMLFEGLRGEFPKLFS